MHLTKTDYGRKMINKTLQADQCRRKYRRTLIPDFVGDLADGRKVIGGVVENISPGGFEITNLPKSFAADKHHYTTVLSGGGKHYRMLVKPCWSKIRGAYHRDIGFKILDAPWQWLELTMQKNRT